MTPKSSEPVVLRELRPWTDSNGNRSLWYVKVFHSGWERWILGTCTFIVAFLYNCCIVVSSLRKDAAEHFRESESELLPASLNNYIRMQYLLSGVKPPAWTYDLCG